MKTRDILALICLFLPLFCYAQYGRLFTVDNELSSSLINDIAEDHYGMIWIATEDGLNRYDGSKFTIYRNDKENPYSLIDNYVRTLFRDRDGNFFVGLFKGLQLYDHATDRLYEVPLQLKNGDFFRCHITCVYQRANGDLLVGTSGQGLFLLVKEGDSFHGREISHVIPSILIISIYEDQSHNLWVSTEDKGVFRIGHDRSVKQFGYKEMGWNLISGFCQDREGRLFAGSLTTGLYSYEEESDSFRPVSYDGRVNLPIKSLYTTAENEIYIGTEGYGIKTYDPVLDKITDGQFLMMTFDLTNSKVHRILQDRSGNTWLGIFQKGVSLLPARNNQFNYIGHKSVSMNSIGSNCVMSLFQDKQQTIWVGTDNGGLYGIDPDGRPKVHFAHTSSSRSVPSTIMCIYEDSNQDLWLGSYLNGLTRVDRQTGYCDYSIELLDENGTPIQRIFDLTEDYDRNLWIGTMGAGLFRLDLKSGEISHYNVDLERDFREEGNYLNNSWINCLLISHDKKLYTGTYDGLGCLDLETMSFISTYGTNRMLAGQIIYTIYEDTNNSIWLGTAEGLLRMNKDNREFTTYTTRNGLPANLICSIKEDEQGFLWIGTSYGISRMDRDKEEFVNYYASDGLQGNEFSKDAAWTDRSGRMYFGGMNGITYFQPGEIAGRQKDMNVYITDFYIHDIPVRKGMKSGRYDIIDRSVMEAAIYRLSHSDNSITIEFSSMEFDNPERISYLYSMNNGSWNRLSNGSNQVTYSNLAPGRYTFRVMANDFNASSAPRELTIEIYPPWYLSGWAKMGYGLLGLFIIFIIIHQIRQRYRERQRALEHQYAEEINEAKLQFFINIAHEIRTPMSLIISPLKKLMNNDPEPERQEKYTMINRNAERILNLINQLMDIRKIDKGLMNLKFRETELIGFIRELYTVFEYAAQSKEIGFSFRYDQPEIKAWIDTTHFDKVILNVLSNAFKFTPEKGLITISIRKITDHIEIIISDNGIGIREEERELIFDRFYQIRNSYNNFNISTGVGLHLTRSLVELHHGTIHVESNEEQPGCRFVIRIPAGNSHLKASDIEESSPEKEPDMNQTVIPSVQEEITPVKVKSKTKSRVLVVEDDEDIRNYICRELATEYHMEQCVNGKEALEKILKKAPDLIISDVMMPEMDGVTLCRKIKQNIHINHIPVILVTAKSREEDNIEGLDIGADAYIVKPFNIELLKKTVGNIIRNRELLKNTFSGNQLQEDKRKKITLKSADDKLLERVMKVINENISNPELNVEMIAQTVGISRVHLHRKLKELTNQSTRDFIRNIRLKLAAELLSSKKLTISEVSDACGFTNLGYFSNAFKDLYGTSPRSYMESHQQEKE